MYGVRPSCRPCSGREFAASGGGIVASGGGMGSVSSGGEVLGLGAGPPSAGPPPPPARLAIKYFTALSQATRRQPVHFGRA
eukprot:4482159-Prymnesium_polylepis.1